MRLAAHWAALHGEPTGRRDPMTTPGGEGTPALREYAVPELAMARQTHPATTRALIADTLDLAAPPARHLGQVVDLACEPWVARRVAVLTRALPADRVGLVDRAVARAITGHAPATVLEIAARQDHRGRPRDPPRRRETDRATSATPPSPAPTSSATAPSSPASPPATPPGSTPWSTASPTSSPPPTATTTTTTSSAPSRSAGSPGPSTSSSSSSSTPSPPSTTRAPRRRSTRSRRPSRPAAGVGARPPGRHPRPARRLSVRQLGRAARQGAPSTSTSTDTPAAPGRPRPHRGRTAPVLLRPLAEVLGHADIRLAPGPRPQRPIRRRPLRAPRDPQGPHLAHRRRRLLPLHPPHRHPRHRRLRPPHPLRRHRTTRPDRHPQLRTPAPTPPPLEDPRRLPHPPAPAPAATSGRPPTAHCHLVDHTGTHPLPPDEADNISHRTAGSGHLPRRHRARPTRRSVAGAPTAAPAARRTGRTPAGRPRRRRLLVERRARAGAAPGRRSCGAPATSSRGGRTPRPRASGSRMIGLPRVERLHLRSQGHDRVDATTLPRASAPLARAPRG